MSSRTTRLKVLFLCTGNSCRSQMAEGWAHALKGDVIEPHSAGIETHGLNPLAVRVTAEAGVDISGRRSKTVRAVRDVPFDYVVTVCDHANETCPAWVEREGGNAAFAGQLLLTSYAAAMGTIPLAIWPFGRLAGV